MGMTESMLATLLPNGSCNLFEFAKAKTRVQRKRLRLLQMGCCMQSPLQDASRDSEDEWVEPSDQICEEFVCDDKSWQSLCSFACIFGGDARGSSAPEWYEKLQTGVMVTMSWEPVLLRLDENMDYLEVREHEVRYSLAELRTCCEVPRMSNDQGAPSFELMVAFSEVEAFRLQFDEEDQRTCFRLVLSQLAHEARSRQCTEVEDGAYVAGSDSGEDIDGSNMILHSHERCFSSERRDLGIRR